MVITPLYMSSNVNQDHQVVSRTFPTLARGCEVVGAQLWCLAPKTPATSVL